MRSALRIAAAVALTLAVLAPSAVAAPEAANASPDEQTLQAAGLTTDGPALLDFFRARARVEPDHERLAALVKQLGDGPPRDRDQAAAALVACGPVAIPALRHAVNSLDDPETAARARKCLSFIEGQQSAALPTAAARLVALRKPPGAAAVLLAYLPFADNQAVQHEVALALSVVAFVEGKAEPAVVQALADPVPVRRAVAGEVLCRADQPDQWPAIRKLLHDPKPTVRLRAALALAQVQDAEVIPVLIDLVGELPPEQRKQAEEVLQGLAGEWAPVVNFQGEDEIARRIRRDAWAAWWKNTDGPALLAALRKRTLTPEAEEKVRSLIKELGAEGFAEREKAQAELVSLGTLALPLLREATKDTDLEVSRRAVKCIGLIERDPSKQLPLAALRLLAVRRPAGGAAAVLAYLPFAENEALAAEAQTALNKLAATDGKPDPAVVRALEDRVVVRRAAAAEALAKIGGPEVRPAVRKLLQDPDKTVRLRTALALMTAKDKQAVAALIDLLADLPPDLADQAREPLYVLAGDRPPEMAVGDAPETRKKNRDAWAAWWKANADKVDLAKLDGRERFLGLTLLIQVGGNGIGRVQELGPDKKVRWQVENLAYPVDAWVLPGNRVLIAEYNGRKVTERDFTGKVLWEKANLRGQVVNVQRLPGGNTFIATDQGLLEVDRSGREVLSMFTIGPVTAAYRARNGHIWVLTGNGQCLHLDSSGKQIKNFPSNRGGGWTSGLDLLPTGGVLISQPDRNRVAEYDAEGRELWKADAPSLTTATRLPNGHVLCSSYGTNRTWEIDRQGKVVWEHKDTMHHFRARRR